MATVEIEEIVEAVESEAERVFRWRLEALSRAGYEYRLAFKLAIRPYVDLHQAVDLLASGCPPETAADILV